MNTDETKGKDRVNIMEQQNRDHNILYERFCFYSRDQLEEESLATFVHNLRNMAQKCNFPGNNDEAVLDRLICGVKDKEIQKLLLNQGSNKFHHLTLENALQMAEENEVQFKSNKQKVEFDQNYLPSTKGHGSVDVTPMNIKSENMGATDISSENVDELNSRDLNAPNPSPKFQNNLSNGISDIVDSKNMNGTFGVSKSEDIYDEEEMTNREKKEPAS